MYADLQGRLHNHFVDIHLAWESILVDDFPLLANGWWFRLVAYYPKNRFAKGMILTDVLRLKLRQVDTVQETYMTGKWTIWRCLWRCNQYLISHWIFPDFPTHFTFAWIKRQWSQVTITSKAAKIVLMLGWFQIWQETCHEKKHTNFTVCLKILPLSETHPRIKPQNPIRLG